MSARGQFAGTFNPAGVNPKAVAVEHNGQLLSSDLFAQTGLAEGDVLELVRFVGGG